MKHVVILMQENRSFDHYFGTLRGVRGFGDKQFLTYPNGQSIFQQPDPARTDLGYLLPYNLTDQVDGDLDHSWVGDHAARNGGAWNNWVAAKTEETMGYFTRDEIPFQYALANDGKTAIVYTVTKNDYNGSTKKVTVPGGSGKTVSWPANQDGYYDVVITANTSDGFRRRYAGRIA